MVPTRWGAPHVSRLKVDAFSSLSHYSAHIRPIWEALPPSVRGQWWAPVNLPRSERLTIVASYRDAQTIGRPYVLCEHGAGQGYTGVTNGSYSGGEGHDRCVLFLCPSERVARRWRERYDVPAVAVGCPRLDRWAEGPSHRGEAALARSGVSVCDPPGMRLASRFGLQPGPSALLVAGVTPNESDSGKKSEKSRGETDLAWHKTGDSPLQPVYDVPASVLSSGGVGPRPDEPLTGTSTPAGRPGGVRSARGVPPGSTRPGGIPIVAISFHWDCALVPETRSAWRYYDPHLPRLVRDPRFRVVGHGHPRLWPTIKRRWAELGVDQWPDVDRVLSESDVVVADNTSLLYEACALGIPTVCLNIPSYRRDVEHGGRFWSSPPGPQVDHPSELADAIACALTDPPAHRAIRARAVEWAYSSVDGHASERAAAAIMEALNDRGMAQGRRRDD